MDGDFGVFLNGGPTHGVPIKFQGENSLLLRCGGNVGIPLQTKQGYGPSSRVDDKNGALLELWHETPCSAHVWTCILGTFLSCMKGVKYSFAFPDGTCDFSGDTALEKGLISRGEENHVVFLELWREAWGSSQFSTGTSGTHSCCLRKVRSLLEL